MDNTFDITADISRQYLRDGRKVLKIFDSGLEQTYPIVAFLQAAGAAVYTYTQSGHLIAGTTHAHDIVTRPVVKPDVITFTVIKGDSHYLCTDFNGALRFTDYGNHSHPDRLIYRETFNPNTLEKTSRLIHKNGKDIE